MRITGKTINGEALNEPVSDFVMRNLRRDHEEPAAAIGELVEILCSHGLWPKDVLRIAGAELKDAEFHNDDETRLPIKTEETMGEPPASVRELREVIAKNPRVVDEALLGKIANLEELARAHGKLINRMVDVETVLLLAANGKKPLPTAEECRELAKKLGCRPPATDAEG